MNFWLFPCPSQVLGSSIIGKWTVLQDITNLKSRNLSNLEDFYPSILQTFFLSSLLSVFLHALDNLTVSQRSLILFSVFIFASVLHLDSFYCFFKFLDFFFFLCISQSAAKTYLAYFKSRLLNFFMSKKYHLKKCLPFVPCLHSQSLIPSSLLCIQLLVSANYWLDTGYCVFGFGCWNFWYSFKYCWILSWNAVKFLGIS